MAIIPRNRHEQAIQHLIIQGAGTLSFRVIVPHQKTSYDAPCR